MTVLQSLAAYYDCLVARGDVAEIGWSRERISYVLVLSSDGVPVRCVDLRVTTKGTARPRLMAVPKAVRRTIAVQPNLLWDKSSYALGRSAGRSRRTAEEHAAFKALHLDLLAGASDPGLAALRRFLACWDPARFDAAPFAADMLDANVVFQLADDEEPLHLRGAARQLVASRFGEAGVSTTCLATGVAAPAERLHPVIKNVEGAQSSGASLVSFNLDASTSFGRQQGDNAPTSRKAALAYGVALNHLLEPESHRRLARPIGDTTIVFWAEAPEALARGTEGWLRRLLAADPADPHDPEPERDGAGYERALAVLQSGGSLPDIKAMLRDDVPVCVLGLSPNAARLSVRFWLTGSAGPFFRSLARFQAAVAIEPRPWPQASPSIATLLVRATAAQERFDTVSPSLAGEVLRAALTDQPLPWSLLTAALTRIRGGGDPASGWHAAAIRAVLCDGDRRPPPVCLDPTHPSVGYHLGRLFALAEITERLAHGKPTGALRDRHFAHASASPARSFPLLLRRMQDHVRTLHRRGSGRFIEHALEQIAGQLPAALPTVLRLEDQGQFVIGYYHQRRTRILPAAAQGTRIEEQDLNV